MQISYRTSEFMNSIKGFKYWTLYLSCKLGYTDLKNFNLDNIEIKEWNKENDNFFKLSFA